MSTTPLPSAPATTVAEAIAAMHELGASFPAEDGVGYFNLMYLNVTQTVADRLHSGVFVDPEFLDRLDVNFANLYLGAYNRHMAGERVCRSWRALFERRTDNRVLPLQFALAGMNAHINHDLPIAVTMTVQELGISLDTPHVRRDYVAVNDVLRDAYPSVRSALQGRIADALDRICGPLDDALSMWGITRAREAAWQQSLRLATVAADRTRLNDVLLTLDRLVFGASYCLLAPAFESTSAARMLEPALDALDAFAAETGTALWGDGTIDGVDDGAVGALLWTLMATIGLIDDLLDGDLTLDEVIDAARRLLQGTT